MAKITDDPRRPDRIIIDYRDALGIRRKPSFPKTPEGRKRAEQELAVILAQSKRACAVSPSITVSEYIRYFVAILIASARKVPPQCAPSTPHTYESLLTLHVEPTLGKFKVVGVSRQMVEKLLEQKAKVYMQAHVSNILAATSAMLTQAQNDGLIAINPLFRMGKAVRGVDWGRHVNTQAMEREERDRFLDTALVHEPAWYPAFATLVYSGLRIGELRGLRRDDVRRHEIKVERQVYAGENKINPGKMVGPPKGSKPGRPKVRSVDLAEQLVPILHPIVTRPGNSPWLFFETPGEPTLRESQSFTNRLGAAMRRVLEHAGLWRDKQQFTPHDLRHTFAVMLITQTKIRTGDLLLYLAQQLGHDKTTITEERYAHWIKMRNRAAVTAAGERAEETYSDLPLASVVLPFLKK